MTMRPTQRGSVANRPPTVPWRELLDDYSNRNGLPALHDRSQQGANDQLEFHLTKARKAVMREESMAQKGLDLQYEVVAEIQALAETIKGNRQRRAFRGWLNARSEGSTTRASDAFSLAAKLASHKANVDKKWVSKRASAARKLNKEGVRASEAVEYLRNNGGIRGVLARKKATVRPRYDSKASWRHLESQVLFNLPHQGALAEGRNVLIANVTPRMIRVLRIVDGVRADRIVDSIVNAKPEKAISERKGRNSHTRKKSKRKSGSPMTDW